MESNVNIYVIIPAYDCAEYIEECLDSVYNQTIMCNVIVGVDGCEKTYKKLQSIKHKYSDLRIYNFKENKGCYITLNSLIAKCPENSYIQIFGADDIMQSDMLEKMAENYPCFSGYSGISFLPKNLYLKLGGYLSWRMGADTEFMERLKKIENIKYLPQMFEYRQHAKQLTRTQNRVELWRYIENNKLIHITPEIHNEVDIVKYDNGRVIWALDSSYAGVSFIADYLNAKIIMYNRRREDFDKMFYDFITYVDDKEQTLEYLTNAKELLLFGAKGVQYLLPILDKLKKRLADYKVTMLITDHWYFKDKYLNGDRINNELKLCKDVKYLFMPDCLKFKADFIKDYSLYYQYLPVPEIKSKKQLKVCHSAGLKVDTDEKGTSIIRNLCKELDLKLDVLSGLAWNKCVEKKAESLIFIDQIISNERAKQMKIDGYGGGIGKSGLEAMKLGAVVLTSGQLIGDKHLPKAPVILVNENNAKTKLTKLLKLPKKELKKIGDKNKKWADKHTGFDFVLNNIDDNIQRCSGIYVSGAVTSFKKRMQEKYKLDEYDINKPSLFFGLYRKEDYELLKNHKSKAVILFCGTDVDYFGRVYKKDYIQDIIKHRVIAISQNVKERLLDYGLESEFIPICPAPIEKNILPKKTAKCVYFYGKGERYGEQFINEIQSKIKFEIIKTTNGKYSQREIQDIYKKCFIGLRLTPKDGLSNTVIEMGLAGRRVIYNSNPLPNALKWDSVDDVVRLINEEYKKRNEDCNIIANEMYEYMKYKDFWLYT